MTSGKLYPTSVRFLLADDIREEKDNKKLHLIGAYIGDDILLRGAPPGVTLPFLALLGIFSGGQGDFMIDVSVFGPDGKEHGKGITLSAGKTDTMKNHAVIIRFPGFQIPMFGEYTVRFDFDHKKIFEYKFQVKEQETKN